MNVLSSLWNFGSSFFRPAPAPASVPVAMDETPDAAVPAGSSAESQVPQEKLAHLPEDVPAAEEARVLEKATSIEDGLSKLKVEQMVRVQDKADRLHQQARATHEKIRNIDTLLHLVQEHCSLRPRDPLDCSRAEIRTAVEVLRRDGIRVPFPEGNLEVAQIGGMFTILGNQRSSLADDLKEASSGYQQCVVERDTLLQQIMSMLNELSRAKSKMASNIRA